MCEYLTKVCSKLIRQINTQIFFLFSCAVHILGLLSKREALSLQKIDILLKM